MRDPKIAIVGAGAIGSFLSARLAVADADVTLIARGARLAALRLAGPRVEGEDTPPLGRVRVTPHAENSADILFICVKAHDLTEALGLCLPAIGPDTIVIPLVNGLPFWYFADFLYDGSNMPAVDPDGITLRTIDPRAVLGCVTYMACELAEDGCIVYRMPPRLVLGRARSDGPEASVVAALLERAGIGVERPVEIRDAVWNKLAINLATNPLSALTNTSISQIRTTGELLSIAEAIADEVRSLARAYGFDTGLTAKTLTATLAGAEGFSTSMRQDARAGRRLELDAICHAPLALAERKGLAMPVTLSIVRLLVAGLFERPVSGK